MQFKLLAGLVCITSGWAFSQAPDTEVMSRIEAALNPGAEDSTGMSIPEMMDNYNVPGLTIAVFNNFELEWTKSYGVKDANTGSPVTPDTLFQSGSISKSLTATATMKAVENGLFSLDDPINTVLKDWKLPSNDFTAIREVTPRMLLSHTAGVSMRHINGYSPDVFLPTTFQILEGSRRANTEKVVVEREPLTKYV